MIKRMQIRVEQERLFGEIVLVRRADAPQLEISREELEADYTTDLMARYFLIAKLCKMMYNS